MTSSATNVNPMRALPQIPSSHNLAIFSAFPVQDKRGIVFFAILDYIVRQLPTCFLLENVSGLVYIQSHGRFHYRAFSLACVLVGMCSGLLVYVFCLCCVVLCCDFLLIKSNGIWTCQDGKLLFS